jgi:16S rRNA (guanine527-N7)-methyltransferase
VWDRHILDAGQLALLADGREWVDLGSGAGLPGLVIAALKPGCRVTLVEKDRRKSAFLRHAAHAMQLPVTVLPQRIDEAAPTLRADVVTARALAPLETLLRYAEPLLRQGAIGLFPKGRGYAAELTKARESWQFEAELAPSRTDPEARIVIIRRLGQNEATR